LEVTTEQEIRRNALDLQLKLTPNESKQARAGRFFEKLPDNFPVLRDLAASAGSKTGVEVVRVGTADATLQLYSEFRSTAAPN
jgi:hypothetical protein